MTSRERQYLLDILIMAKDAVSFVQGKSFEEFASDLVLRRAVLYSLTIIGEAAGRIDASAESEVPDLPWRRMKNLRNVLVHQYEGVNLGTIWEIVTESLPAVIAALDPHFPELSR